MIEEEFPLVTAEGDVIGKVRRSEAHGNPDLIHPVVHCLVEGAQQTLLLQLRSMTKDIQPGRWDTSVGGHLHYGEAVVDAVVREIREEIGLTVAASELTPLYRYVMRSAVETELVYTYLLHSLGPFVAQPEEVSKLQFFTWDEIDFRLGTGCFTPNFEDEYRRYRATKLEMDRQ